MLNSLAMATSCIVSLVYIFKLGDECDLPLYNEYHPALPNFNNLSNRATFLGVGKSVIIANTFEMSVDRGENI
jgi:hypothetical protein